jgi:hypothetical protein
MTIGKLQKTTPAAEPEFTVLDPRGQQASSDYIPLAPRLLDLNGKTICFIK